MNIGSMDQTGGIISIFNFSDLFWENYEVKMEGVKEVNILVYSDWECYSGRTLMDDKVLWVEHNRIRCSLQPFSALLAVIK